MLSRLLAFVVAAFGTGRSSCGVCGKTGVCAIWAAETMGFFIGGFKELRIKVR
jgi:hypothetical protein